MMIGRKKRKKIWGELVEKRGVKLAFKGSWEKRFLRFRNGKTRIRGGESRGCLERFKLLSKLKRSREEREKNIPRREEMGMVQGKKTKHHK